MSLNPSAGFAAANELAHKTPMYTAAFQTTVGDTYLISAVAAAGPILYLTQAVDTWVVNEWVGYTAVITTVSGQQYTRVVYTNTADTITFNQSLPPESVLIGDEFRLDFFTEFCTYQPAEDPFDLKAPRKPYISYVSGGGYSISPDEGSASSATLKIELQDKNLEVTNMIHNATGRLQKKRCVVKAGYIGLKESEMLTVYTGLVTDYERDKDGSWNFSISDVIRDLNKSIFRGASDTNPYLITGNPVTLLLELLISENGDGTRGKYDKLPPGYGLGIATSLIDIERFESIRDTYYPSTAILFSFSITEREKAVDFFTDQLFKPLNMYPMVRGDGKFSAQIYRPVTAPYSATVLNEDDMLEVPAYQGNLTDLINEVQFSYNYDGDDYRSIDVFADAVSINSRGVGDRTLDIEVAGLHSDLTDTDDFLERSVSRIFSRYAVPPIKLNVKCMLKTLLIEAGDIVSVSNKFLPNLETGSLDFELIQMEVIKRTVDWKRGSVSLELLQTGYEKGKYAAISPAMRVSAPGTASVFTVDNVKDYVVGYKVSVYQRTLDINSPTPDIDWYHFELIEGTLGEKTFEIIDITGTQITIAESLSINFNTDMRIVYSDEADLDVNSVPTPQNAWGYITATGDPNAYLITT